MESHLSRKFEKKTGGFESNFSGKPAVSPERPLARGRNPDIHASTPIDLDLFPVIPLSSKKGDPSRKASDFGTVFRLEQKNGDFPTSCQETQDQWESLFDCDEGFELSMSVSNTSFAQQPSVDGGSVLEKSHETPEEKLPSSRKATSPQKVADFPFPLERQASF